MEAWYFDLELLAKYWGPERVYHHTVSGTLVYALREGLRWSDGTPLRAGDYEYAWKRALDPATRSPNAKLLFDLKGGRDAGKNSGHGSTTFNTDVPAHPADFVLGRSTKTSVTLNVLTYQDLEGFVAYGTEKGRLTSETKKQVFKKGQPVEIPVGSLRPDTHYHYEFRSRATAGLSSKE